MTFCEAANVESGMLRGYICAGSGVKSLRAGWGDSTETGVATVSAREYSGRDR